MLDEDGDDYFCCCEIFDTMVETYFTVYFAGGCDSTVIKKISYCFGSERG
jgi:hypothetical protein